MENLYSKQPVKTQKRIKKIIVILVLVFLLSALYPVLSLADVTFSTSPSAPDGDNGWYKTIPTVTINTDNPANTYYQWPLKDLNWTKYVAPFSAIEGENLLNYGIDDGSQIAAQGSITLNVDSIAPQIKINSGPKGNVKFNYASFGVSSTDNKGGSSDTDLFSYLLFSYSYRLGGKQWSAFAKADEKNKSYAKGMVVKDIYTGEIGIGFRNLSAGNHTFEVRVKDDAGNISDTTSRSFKVPKRMGSELRSKDFDTFPKLKKYWFPYKSLTGYLYAGYWRDNSAPGNPNIGGAILNAQQLIGKHYKTIKKIRTWKTTYGKGYFELPVMKLKNGRYRIYFPGNKKFRPSSLRFMYSKKLGIKFL